MPQCIYCTNEVEKEGGVCDACVERVARDIEKAKTDNGTPFGGGGVIIAEIVEDNGEEEE